jgi:hypothetical protein
VAPFKANDVLYIICVADKAATQLIPRRRAMSLTRGNIRK